MITNQGTPMNSTPTAPPKAEETNQTPSPWIDAKVSQPKPGKLDEFFNPSHKLFRCHRCREIIKMMGPKKLAALKEAQ